MCVCVCVCGKDQCPRMDFREFFFKFKFLISFFKYFLFTILASISNRQRMSNYLKTSNFLKKGKKTPFFSQFFHKFFHKSLFVRSCAVWSLDGIWLAKGQSGKGFIDSLPIPFLYSLLCVMGVRRRRISHPPLGGWVVWVSACVRVYTLL